MSKMIKLQLNLVTRLRYLALGYVACLSMPFVYVGVFLSVKDKIERRRLFDELKVLTKIAFKTAFIQPFTRSPNDA